MRKPDRKLDFILVGAQKSGTTALHYLLQKHPKITMGDRQEMHFFDDEKVFSAGPDYQLLHDHFPAAGPPTIAGECTPSYLYWEPAAQRIHQYNPAIQLLAVLRNPIDRAFAHWNMQRFKGREPLDFLDAIAEEAKRTSSPLSIEARRFSYVARGFYSRQIQRFLDLFPREQFKIVKADDFKNRQLETMNSIFDFLGLEPVTSVRKKDHNVVPYERAMTAGEREEGLRMFAQEIIELEQLLGWDCSDWRDAV